MGHKIEFTFNHEKATEAIIYVAQNIKEPTLIGVNKLLYFADKTSLERYGRFIFGDTYFAMEHGPVPSNAYDLIKETGNMGSSGFIIENGHFIKPLREPDLDQLSESDVICLDQIIQMYKDTPNWKRRQDSHDMIWQNAWRARGDKRSVVIPIEDIIATLEDGDDLVEHLIHLNND